MQIAENAGEDGAVVANKVLENKDANYGYDARLDRYCDMVKEGIIDPTKVVRSRAAERGQRRHAAADQRRPGGRHAEGGEEAGGRRRRRTCTSRRLLQTSPSSNGAARLSSEQSPRLSMWCFFRGLVIMPVVLGMPVYSKGAPWSPSKSKPTNTVLLLAFS